MPLTTRRMHMLLKRAAPASKSVPPVRRYHAKKRVAYPGDRIIEKLAYTTIHPNKTRVVVGAGTTRVESVSIPWPLMPGMEEDVDVIKIPSTLRDYTLLKGVTRSQSFMVYVWDSLGKVAYARGNFHVDRGNPTETKYVLRPGDHPEARICAIAEVVAGEVMQEMKTVRAIQAAICGGSDDEEEEEEERPPKRTRGSTPTPPTTTSPTVVVNPAPAPKLFQRGTFNQHSTPVLYNGNKCRSVAEARFAYALDLMGIEYTFERMVFARPGGGTYKPDFFLPAQQLVVEIKPCRPLVEEELRCEELSEAGLRIVCMFGNIGVLPFAHNKAGRNQPKDYRHHEGMRGMAWHKGERLNGEVAFVVGENPRSQPSPLQIMGGVDVPHLDIVCSSRDGRWQDEGIRVALEKAKRQK